jgi:hypothetical protein
MALQRAVSRGVVGGQKIAEIIDKTRPLPSELCPRQFLKA